MAPTQLIKTIFLMMSLTLASSMEIETELMEIPSQRKKQCNKRAAEPDEPFGKKEHDFLYVESKRARLEREKEEKRRKALEIEFSPQELALATVPGMEFDPRERSFAPDELRPQPIIRKRKKVRRHTLNGCRWSLLINDIFAVFCTNGGEGQ